VGQVNHAILLIFVTGAVCRYKDISLCIVFSVKVKGLDDTHEAKNYAKFRAAGESSIFKT
jgi:hypothetical protein